MTDPKNRVLVAVTFSILILLLNIVAVSTGAAEEVYTQIEASFLINKTLSNQPFYMPCSKVKRRINSRVELFL